MSEGEAMPRSGYREKFTGRLIGLLQWAQFEALWARLAERSEGWYVRDFREKTLPEAPMPPEAFRQFLSEAEDFLRRRHREDYCGFLYVDDPDDPTFMKVFDPRKMGSACGCGGTVVPRWTISRMPPQPVGEEAEAQSGKEEPAARRPSLLRRLFG